MDNELLQKVFDLIEPILPIEWNNMLLYIGYTSGSYSMKFYIRDDKANFTDCFSLKSVGKAQLIKLFMNIDKIIAPVRNQLEENDKWSVLTLIVDKDGKMKADFDYTDISENSIAYERKWKDKYLK